MKLISKIKNVFLLIRITRLLVKFARNMTNVAPALAADRLSQKLTGHFSLVNKVVASKENMELASSLSLELNANLESFRTYEEGTVAREFARFMDDRSYDLEVLYHDKKKASDLDEYISLRMNQTHDLWHLITGFDTDIPGEAGLQAFTLAQLHTPMSAIALAGVFIDLLVGDFKSDDIEDFMKAIVNGWQMGKKSKQLLSIDWNKKWDTPIEDLRGELGIKEYSDLSLTKIAS